MKKIFTLLLLITTLNLSVKAQNLLIENFDFSATDIAGQNGWTSHSGTADPIATTTGLTYTDYAGSGIGNAANVLGAGYDYNKGLSDSISTNGSVLYTSLLLNFTQASATATTGGYFFHLGNRTSSTNFTSFCARLWAKTDASGNLNIGITNGSTASYLSTNYQLNTTYLVIIKYTINTAGADEVLMWIRSAGVPASEALAGTPDVTLTTEAGQDIIDAIAIRQASNIPDYIIDGIRVGKTWEESVLPLSLKSFSASLVNQTASLTWNTSNENNVDGFSIEKSNDGRTFNSIGFLAAKNASSASYSFSDGNVSGLTYYRLKIIDKDGKYSYSKTITVNTKKSSIKLDIFPNPVASNLTVSHEKATVNAAIKVVTVDGKVVLTRNLQAGATQSTIDVSKLIKGNYLVVFTNDDNTSSTQFVKQ